MNGDKDSRRTALSFYRPRPCSADTGAGRVAGAALQCDSTPEKNSATNRRAGRKPAGGGEERRGLGPASFLKLQTLWPHLRPRRRRRALHHQGEIRFNVGHRRIEGTARGSDAASMSRGSGVAP
jgi:hypothetical protein